MFRIIQFIILFTAILYLLTPDACAFSFTQPGAQDFGFKNLVYGGSSGTDLQRVLGPPDEIIKSTQMYPLIENYYYYAEGGSGAATVFVLENGLLVGMHYKSPENQYIDLTYFLINNGDRLLNFPMRQGFRGYYPYFNMYNMGY